MTANHTTSGRSPEAETRPVTVITGAAGGIGGATARTLHAGGHNLLCVDHNQEGLDHLTQAIGHHRVDTLAQDLADPHAAQAIVRRCLERVGRIDNLVLVAGIGQLGPTSEIAVDQWDLLQNVNLRANFLLAQAALPTLIEHQGTVVAIASIAGLQGWAYSAAYAASKAGLIALMKSLAIEFGPTGVRINVVAPGGVDTGMASDRHPTDHLDPQLRKRSTGLQGRRAQPHEIADVVSYLTSERASFIHGAVIPVDGGAFA